MDEDKELLKMAAKAAGMNWIDDRQAGLTIQRPEGDGVYNFAWNPLADDGAALRLAVDLRILVDPDGEQYAFATATVKGKGGLVDEPHNGDPRAATRRAIVRAAAEIAVAQEKKEA